MNRDIIEGNWKQIKGVLKQKWGEITDNDIMQMKGTKDEMVGFLQKKYGYQKDQAESELKKFINENGWS